jgi:hypothetical protein
MAAPTGTVQAHPHVLGSILQTLVDTVISRQSQLPQSGTATPQTVAQRAAPQSSGPPPTTTNTRPDTSQALVAAATEIARLKACGQPLPDAVPADLKAQFGSDIDGAWECAKLTYDLLEAKVTGNEARIQQLQGELRFSTCDPGFALAIVEYLEYFGSDGKHKAIPYISAPTLDSFVVETLPKNARVAIIGDWGTGTAEAVAVLHQALVFKPDVLIHLGDIYYSGVPRECTDYFLDIINTAIDRTKGALPIYNLSGNHDMYDGGVGFYALLPQLNPPGAFSAAQAQPASFCCLRTQGGSWQFLLMDTGYNDHDPFNVTGDVTFLQPDEEAWHVDKIAKFAKTGGRTILLSHHQLFSAFETIGDLSKRPADQSSINPLLWGSWEKFKAAAAPGGGSGDIAAWFWGHEHNLCIYQPYQGVTRGRCAGHGGIPMFVENHPYRTNAKLTNPPVLVDDPSTPGQPLQLASNGTAYAHGFLIIDLNDDQKSAVVNYYQDSAPGVPMYTETL